MTDRLKSCPFCDGEAEIKHQGLNWFVRCKYCFCRTSMHTTEFFARCSWNRRKPMDRIVKRLKEVSFIDWDEKYIDNGECLIYLADAIEIVKDGKDNEK